MAKKRGFLAEIHHQSQLAEQRKRQQATAALKAQSAALRQAEQYHAQYARAVTAAAKATEAEQKAAEREAKRLHEEALRADAEAMNADLARVYDEIDTILSATLEVDDYVDLENLRQVAEHPPFPRSELELLVPRSAPVMARDEPRYVEPAAPSGIGGLLGGKKRHAELVTQARTAFEADHASWRAEVADIPRRQLAQDQAYQEVEAQRAKDLAAARLVYDAECRERDAAVQVENQGLDELISGLAYGVESAVQEYVSIVLSNSIYPDAFPVEHDFEFDSASQELRLTAVVPGPNAVPTVKEYKFVRAKAEIDAVSLTQKEQKDRYSGALAQVALRSLHEVFEADRAGRIQTIALTVAVESTDAATGRPSRTPLVAVAADRATFMSFDLADVLPAATLQHLGAQISKNPFTLTPIDLTKGVRSR